ncbi:monovalent cation:H+ antiporter, CPA1 family [Nocardioides lianchengensis]|uniref:Monovalent cation:H+ antiporter, CPA1 family n=1 Tax=Nocardioides lianchengensis TaxID=1045774 RepID=A0A1G6YGK4_9ACTN|nr:sodium:proton antiporter [Nocardioides lianchengensis]NYG09653.1 CPA1 family monovalent cation:H+ antiporter [Nocardioides lianchengensis]SDD89498.1 monovalent cation:H+ antiporter, CPA1 family [Nocardioides lianchengensis]
MDVAVIGLLAVLAIAGVSAVAARLGVAAPLLLVATGVVVSLLPFVPPVEIDPEWILMGVLPPLLYSASVSMPAMDFRRDFGTIGSLSVVLVVISSLLVGLFIAAVVPGVELATGIALGAIISPTDAVATSIVKRLGAPSRVVTVLEGESLLNDATALVLLRSAIAATSVSVSVWGVVGDFVYAVAIAVLVGLLVGRLNLLVRARVTDPAVNTAISFVVPFAAYLPVEHLGGSGLVAAVAAGLHTGHSAPRYLEPAHRRAEEQNWRTVELLLEGGVFLLMGLELYGLVEDLDESGGGLGTAVWVGAVAAAIVVAVRAAYVVPLLVALGRRAGRGEAVRERIAQIQGRIDHPDSRPPSAVRRCSGPGCGAGSPTSTTWPARRSGGARARCWCGPGCAASSRSRPPRPCPPTPPSGRCWSWWRSSSPRGRSWCRVARCPSSYDGSGWCPARSPTTTATS